ncbi:metallophosphoesterase [Paraburkholderia sp. EG287A]|uniref:metallophosphoesterase n=1 Tax=Paraburkholderia sp. EG287A TaxID=3237012 RepID=UPI0034D385D6
MSTPATPVVRRFAPGPGRDFVIGDLHGAFSLGTLEQVLELVDFDTAVDRLFSVGDLIDRGEHSKDALALLRKPWFHATLANHEELALDCYAGGVYDRNKVALHVQKIGFGWWLDLSEETRQDFLDAFARLPLAIEVEAAIGLVGIVHADVPEGWTWPEFTEQLEAGNSAARNYALWSRERIEDRQDASGVAGVARVYVGHTPLFNGVRKLGNVWYIDTGAVYGVRGVAPEGHLSLLELTVSEQAAGSPLRLAHVAIYR